VQYETSWKGGDGASGGGDGVGRSLERSSLFEVNKGHRQSTAPSETNLSDVTDAVRVSVAVAIYTD